MTMNDPTAKMLIDELDMMIEDVAEVNDDDDDALTMERMGNINDLGDSATMIVHVNGKRFRVTVTDEPTEK